MITADAKVEYRDVEFAEDMCQAGQVINFGKTSAPAIERANGVPYVSGMGGDGQIRGAQNGTPSFYGRLVSPGCPPPARPATRSQWSKKANPFKPAGSATTPSTSVLVNPGAGVWYYRVRGVDKTLPTERCAA